MNMGEVSNFTEDQKISTPNFSELRGGGGRGIRIKDYSKGGCWSEEIYTEKKNKVHLSKMIKN